MGKHNGKARRSGLSVGSALVNRARREGRSGGPASLLHTTDINAEKNSALQSVIETSDLQEMMHMAELAERDFAAEKNNVVVISTGATTRRSTEEEEEERAACEVQNAHRLRIPRRPVWNEKTTLEQLDAQEKAAFLEWRRDLAALESDERLVLTPFEKNLEVWRQLWRVIERSDIVVQVVDSRNPLTYRSEDLESYCLEMHPTKRTVVLLNKADLLPYPLRRAWADYFDSTGVRYAFWSAKAASEDGANEDTVGAMSARAVSGKTTTANSSVDAEEDPRARVLGVPALLELLEQEVQKSVEDALRMGLQRTSRGERFVVGLTGYPNVGKSSTINALFGSKKTAVAATPGKTKHFQTLNVSESLCLCDCPGLVLPQFARSKAEMVAAGVIPIDRLTDIRAPVAAVGARVSREQLEKAYGFRLPSVGPEEDDKNRPPTAMELLRTLALSRGWVGASGLPDETRAGRRILKDFVDGIILACTPPPDASEEIMDLVDEISGRRRPPKNTDIKTPGAVGHGASPDRRYAGRQEENETEVCPTDASPSSRYSNNVNPQPLAYTSSAHHDEVENGDIPTENMLPADIGASGTGREDFILDEADIDLFETMNLAGKNSKPIRAAHKFQKKPSRVKGRQASRNNKDALYDGAPLTYGKRGGLVRVSTQ